MGDGPTTAWLHGFASTPAVFDGLRARHGGHAPRLLGHGADHDARTFEEEVDRLAEALSAGATLVGYSMGGRLALGVLARHPARVGAVVLVAASPGIEDDVARAARRRDDEALAARLERLALEPPALAQRGLEAFFAEWDAQPLFARRRAGPPREGLTARGLARALRVIGAGAMPSLWGALAATPVPVAYVVGDEDARFAPIAAQVRARAPHVDVVVAPSSDHDVLSCAPQVVDEVVAKTKARRGR
ncbi:MAG: alpha/beta fold hydrolase [Myxococcales bacterium]|nr:alpha/beta fold hydrolase [Myxococcales bacterium]